MPGDNTELLGSCNHNNKKPASIKCFLCADTLRGCLVPSGHCILTATLSEVSVSLPLDKCGNRGSGKFSKLPEFTQPAGIQTQVVWPSRGHVPRPPKWQPRVLTAGVPGSGQSRKTNGFCFTTLRSLPVCFGALAVLIYVHTCVCLCGECFHL